MRISINCVQSDPLNHLSASSIHFLHSHTLTHAYWDHTNPRNMHQSGEKARNPPPIPNWWSRPPIPQSPQVKSTTVIYSVGIPRPSPLSMRSCPSTWILLDLPTNFPNHKIEYICNKVHFKVSGLLMSPRIWRPRATQVLTVPLSCKYVRSFQFALERLNCFCLSYGTRYLIIVFRPSWTDVTFTAFKLSFWSIDTTLYCRSRQSATSVCFC